MLNSNIDPIRKDLAPEDAYLNDAEMLEHSLETLQFFREEISARQKNGQEISEDAYKVLISLENEVAGTEGTLNPVKRVAILTTREARDGVIETIKILEDRFAREKQKGVEITSDHDELLTLLQDRLKRLNAELEGN